MSLSDLDGELLEPFARCENCGVWMDAYTLSPQHAVNSALICVLCAESYPDLVTVP